MEENTNDNVSSVKKCCNRKSIKAKWDNYLNRKDCINSNGCKNKVKINKNNVIASNNSNISGALSVEGISKFNNNMIINGSLSLQSTIGEQQGFTNFTAEPAGFGLQSTIGDAHETTANGDVAVFTNLLQTSQGTAIGAQDLDFIISGIASALSFI